MSLRTKSPDPRNFLSYAHASAFVPRTTAILARLGYRITDVDTFARENAEGSAPAIDLLIVDERRMEEVPDLDGEGGPPVVLLTGRNGASRLGTRIVGAIRKPAGLHDIYRLGQEIFEETPRSLPRIDTDLPVECDLDGRPFSGALISLSENGGLLRTQRRLPLGVCFDLQLDLPTSGRFSIRAEAAYQKLPDLGVVFSGIAPRARAAIGDYVADMLLS